MFLNGSKPKSRLNRKHSQGQAMAEFAIALPILMLIILGLIESARLILIYSAVVTSSREAARYGSTLGILESNPDAFQYQDCAGITQAAENVAFLMDPDDLQITIEYDTGPGTAIFDTCIDTDGDGIDSGIDVEPLEVDDPDSADPEDTILVPKRITVTSSTIYSPILPIIPQFTIRNIETSSSRTFLGMVEYWP